MNAKHDRYKMGCPISSSEEINSKTHYVASVDKPISVISCQGEYFNECICEEAEEC